MMTYAVILAGGKGERLWPASIPTRPKFFLPLAEGGRSLIQATYDRIAPLVGEENIYIVTERKLSQPIQHSLGLSPDRMIIEPHGRNTAPAIGLAALFVSACDPGAIMIALPADHLIQREQDFREVLKAAIVMAEQGHLVTLGIPPTYPATGYGYLEQGEPVGEEAFRVRRFIEKPEKTLASQFLAQGGYFWNAGIFIWRAERILAEIDRFLPQLSTALKKLRPLLGTSSWEEALAEAWPGVEAASIDYGVMEHAQDVVMIPAEVGWCDLGDWGSVWEVLAKDEAGIAVRGEHISMDTAQTLIWGRSGKLIATLGVKDLAIVDTPEALLIADRTRAQEVRTLVHRAQKPPPNWEELLKLDTSGMIEELLLFPHQCQEAIALGEKTQLPINKLMGFSRVLALGMGGSGITGDLLSRLLSVEVIVARSYTIPPYIGEETLALAVSYSGDTEETLSAFEESLSRTERALAISSDGKLKQLCANRRIPWIGIPAGHQPRAALGWLLFTLLSIFRRLSAFSEDLSQTLAVLSSQTRALGPRNPENRAQQIASALLGRVPLIYGAGDTGPVAFRWKTQINENAKQPAFWAELPELCHNEIVGYELTPRIFPQGIVVFLRSRHDPPQIQTRIEILKEMLARRGLPCLEAFGEGKGRIEELFSLIYLGDWVSVYLALLNGVDPTPVHPIQELKDRLAKQQNVR